VREEFRAAQAVVKELDTETIIPHHCNDVTESGGHASWDFFICLGACADESKVVLGFTISTE
jgi:hypothetical protein